MSKDANAIPTNEAAAGLGEVRMKAVERDNNVEPIDNFPGKESLFSQSLCILKLKIARYSTWVKIDKKIMILSPSVPLQSSTHT
jgi:hypothetical protein